MPGIYAAGPAAAIFISGAHWLARAPFALDTLQPIAQSRAGPLLLIPGAVYQWKAGIAERSASIKENRPEGV